MTAENVTYFGSFRVEHIPYEITKFIGYKNIKTNIYRIQPYKSIMCEYFCIGFIGFMLKDKGLLEYCPKECKRNDKMILKYFQ